MARTQKEETKVEAPKSNKVKVVATLSMFVDQVTGTEIRNTPVEVEMHPWLQAQVNAGHVVIVE